MRRRPAAVWARREAPRDVGIRPPQTVVRREVRKGVEPKSEVRIVFSGPFENTEANRLLVSTMAATLSGNLHRTLREDEGGTYGVSVEPVFGFRPVQEYRVSIAFGCDPARADALVADTWRVIAAFKETGPSPGQLADGRLIGRAGGAGQALRVARSEVAPATPAWWRDAREGPRPR